MLREGLEPLTGQNLREARARWDHAGVGKYRMSFVMNGTRYDVLGEDGIVLKLTAQGRETNPRQFRFFGVEGLFGVLAMDLENLEDPRGPFAGGGQAMFLRVRFNDRYGYIEKYLRSSGGRGRGASIEMIDFEVVGAS